MNKSLMLKLKNWVYPYIINKARKYKIPGISYSIFNKDEIILKGGVGSDPDTSIFRVASITKSITALAIAKLYQDKIIDIDDPVNKYIPSINKDIKIKHILAHTSGIKRDITMPIWINDVFPTNDELMDELNSEIYVYKPDKKYKYSNLSYAILGLVINKVVGDYDEYLNKNIFMPLALKHTYTDINKIKNVDKNRLLQGYGRIEIDKDLIEKRDKEKDINTLAYSPAVGSATTVSELSIIVREWFLTSERIIDRDIKNEFLKPRKVELDPYEIYSYGLKHWEYGNKKVIGYGGAFAGFRAYFIICPKYSIGSVVLTNTINDVAKGIGEALIGMYIKVMKSKNVDKRYDIYEGLFTNRWRDIQIIALGDHLYYYDLDSIDPSNNLIKIEGDPVKGFIDMNCNGKESKGERIEYEFNTKGGIRRIRVGSSILYPKLF